MRRPRVKLVVLLQGLNAEEAEQGIGMLDEEMLQRPVIDHLWNIKASLLPVMHTQQTCCDKPVTALLSFRRYTLKTCLLWQRRQCALLSSQMSFLIIA